MTVRLIKGCYFVDIRWQRQRIRRKSPLNTRRGAETYERQVREQLVNGTFEREEPKPPHTPTFAAFAQEFLANYVRPNNKPSEAETKASILRLHLTPAFGAVPLDQITVRAIERYKATKLGSGLSAKTVVNHLTVLRRLLVVAAEWDLLTKVPTIAWLKLPEPEFDFLDFSEAERLVHHADEQWRPMIVVALRTGLRLGELLALRWEDVDLVAGRLLVRRSLVRGVLGTPKSGKSREVPLSPEAVRMLKAHRHLKGELVFCDADGQFLTKNQTKHPLWRAAKHAGLRSLGWHVLRHTFASHLAMRGVPIISIQQMLGHSTIEMTMRYAHLAPAINRQAVELLDQRSPAEFGHLMGNRAV